MSIRECSLNIAATMFERDLTLWHKRICVVIPDEVGDISTLQNHFNHNSANACHNYLSKQLRILLQSASHDSSVGDIMHLTVCPLHGPRVQFPVMEKKFQGFFPWLMTHTWRGDGPRQNIKNPLKGYEEYEAKQLLLPSGPPPRVLRSPPRVIGSPNDQNGQGFHIFPMHLLTRAWALFTDHNS